MREHRSEVNDLKKEITDLRHSLEFSQGEVVTMKKQIVDLTCKLEENNNTDHKNEEFNKRLAAVEDDSRKLNIRIDGLPEDSGENAEQTQHKIQKLFQDKLQIPVALDHATRIGNKEGRGSPTNSSTKPRTIIAKCKQLNDRAQIFQNKAKLKGSDIYINEDLSPATLAIRRHKWPELQQKRQQGLIAFFVGSEIRTKPRTPTTANTHTTGNPQNANGTRNSTGQAGKSTRNNKQSSTVNN